MEDAHKKQHVLVVAHTHWDREWYASFQAFRVRLVDMMDSLLEILRTDPEFQFTLDGQTVLLEDYLEIGGVRWETILNRHTAFKEDFELLLDDYIGDAFYENARAEAEMAKFSRALY